MKVELFYFDLDGLDWRMRALFSLEPDIRMFARGWKIPGLEEQDIEQELRIHLYNKLPKYNPYKSQLRTWASTVMRNRRIDLKRRANDLLDSPMRVFPDIEATDIENKGQVGQE